MQEKLARLRAELAELTSSVKELSVEQVGLRDNLGHATADVENAHVAVGSAQRTTEIARGEIIECNARLDDAAAGVKQALLRPAFLHAGLSCGEASCCIVSTLKGVCEEELVTWLFHHLECCSFTCAYLFFDDSSEFADLLSCLAPWGSRVVATSVVTLHQHEYVNCRRYEALKPMLAEDWLARQELHVEIAMRWAHGIGIRWLLHIDLDELFLVGKGSAPQHFGSIPDSIDAVCYLNHEGVPELGQISTVEALKRNRFAGVHLFRKNPQCFGECSHLKDFLPRISGCRELDDDAWQWKLENFVAECGEAVGSHAQTAKQAFGFWLKRTKLSLGRAQYFLAYANGKGAVRIGSELLPCGVHAFGSQDTAQFWAPDEAAVLHYAHGCFEAFVEKMRRLQASSGTWWKRFALYSQGRDNHCDALDHMYRHAIALDANDAGEARRQVDMGICFRYDANIPEFCRADSLRASFLTELD